MERTTNTDTLSKSWLFVVIMLLGLTLHLGAQEQESRAPWILADHDMSTEEFSEDIAEIISSGYLPVGIEVRGNTLSTLYSDRPDIEVERWSIQEFERLDNLNQDLSQPMSEGWVPMDISKTENGLVVLFIKTEEIQVEGWNIAIGPIETESMGQTFAAWRERGRTAFGITASENEEMWYLFLDLEGDETPDRVFFDAYPRDEVQTGISEQMAQGGDPWGLMRLGDTYFVQFLF
ncbi:MAG: hypothetical protein ACLFPP_09215 [Spirochaetaceae bacterium]